MKANDQTTNKLIAEKATEYLKNRMLLNQKVLNSKEEETEKVPLDSFMTLYKEYTEAIHEANKRKKELGEEVVLEKDDTDISMRQVMVHAKKDFVRKNADSIVISEEQIDELMGFVQTSIERYGLGEVAYSSNETFFLRGILGQLQNSMCEQLGEKAEQDEEYQKLNKWHDFIFLTEKVGFCEDFSGRLSTGYRELFSITTHEYETVFRMDEEGKVVTEMSLEEEDILLAEDIYTGFLHVEGGSYHTLFLKKQVNNEDMVKAFYHDHQLYSTTATEESEDYVELELPVNEFLKENNLEYLTRLTYDTRTLQAAMRAYNHNINVTKEEKEQMEEVIQVAADWWANAVCFPKFDNGDKSETGAMTMMLAMLNNAHTPMPDEETIEEFKENLGKKIRTGLMNNPNYYSLSVDYGPDRDLSDAASDAKLQANFPWKTSMSISTTKVSVKAGYGAESQVLYDANQKVKEKQGSTKNKDLK